MRHLITLAAVAALAGCSVDVEGAACATPGSSEGCPAGQACGAGKTCSVAAAACASPCTPGVVECRDGDVKECTLADPVCGHRVVKTACTPNVTTCGAPLASPGALQCRCVNFLVDPAGATAGTECRFAAVASAIGAAQGFGVQEVRLGGAPGQDYGADAADAAPLVVPAGVAVVGDDAPLSPASRVLTLRGAGAEAVRLEEGATLAGVTVRRGTGGPLLGVRIVGASPSAGSSLTVVEVDGLGEGGPFATGVRVEGAGAVAIDRLVVQGAAAGGAAASGRGMEVERDRPDQAVTVADGVFVGNDTGVRLIRGDLTLMAPTITGSVKEGVDASPTSGLNAERGLQIENGLLAHNGSGLRAAFMQRLTLLRNRICGNTGMARTVYASTRSVGGVYGVGNGTAQFSFHGNLLHGNGGDQLLVYLANDPWDLSGAGSSCDAADRNVFAGYAAPGVAVAAFGAPVVVRYAAWKVALPASPTDFLFSDGGTLDAGTAEDPMAVCPKPADAELVCPAP